MIQFPIQFLKVPEVLARVGFSRAQLNRLRAAGQFPKPVTIGSAGVRWVASEIDDWMRQRMAARDAAAA